MNKPSGRRLLRAATATIALAAMMTALDGGAAAAAPAPAPSLRLVAAATSVTLDRWGSEGVFLDVGAHFVAGAVPFEIWAKRESYQAPIVANQVISEAGQRRTVALPAGLLEDFTGFPAFSHLTLTDANGYRIVDRDETFCPNGYGARTRPDAPDRSPYPQSCPFNAFTLGSVWGIQAGWSAPTIDRWSQAPVDVPVGEYTATTSINQPYRDIFGIPADQASVTVRVSVVDATTGPQGRAAPPRAGEAPGPASAQPATSRPTGRAVVPDGPKPDLRSLPAFGIEIGTPEGPADGNDYLSFAATVWTGGTSPLVVDGFRRADEDVMDAYQYFYDEAGAQTGYAQVGTMEWDARDGHHHWHFTDFAKYSLLNESKEEAVRSGKEAFCLANTDAVDYTLPQANWRPENTDLHTSCGESTSLAVREVLDVGSGDTYGQYLPGQSFDITDLPNGTYFIEVAANPDGQLYETDTGNNTSHREVILGGVPGARTVVVPPHHGIVG